MTMKETLGPADGYVPEKITFNAWNRTGGAVAVGDLLALDEAKSQAESTSIDPTSATGSASIYANLTTAAAAHFKSGSMVLVEDLLSGAGADNTLVRVMLEGIGSAFVIAASGNIAIGDPLVAAASKNLDAILAVNERIIAKALVAHTAPTTRTLSTVRFFGEMQGAMEGGT